MMSDAQRYLGMLAAHDPATCECPGCVECALLAVIVALIERRVWGRTDSGGGR